MQESVNLATHGLLEFRLVRRMGAGQRGKQRHHGAEVHGQQQLHGRCIAPNQQDQAPEHAQQHRQVLCA